MNRQNLTLADTEELMADIRLYLTLEKIPSNIEFWKARPIVFLCVPSLLRR